MVNETADQELKRIKEECAKLAEFLKRQNICHACVVEGQERYCQVIDTRWAGRELLRIVSREGWLTERLGDLK